jgi:hypothetical protein
MDTTPILIPLWDFGWLCRDAVALPGASTDHELIEQYVASRAFHTSLLPNDKDESGIHGPFVADRLSVADFMPLQQHDLNQYLASIALSDTMGEDAVEMAKVHPVLNSVFERGHRCYVLRRDERNGELFHEWGFVLSVFREFLFVGPERNSVERFVIGYD